MRLRAFFCFLFLTMTCLFSDDSYLIIKGYLGHDELKEANEKIEKLKHTEGGKVIIQLNSSSGELQEVFDLAQNLFELRMRNKKFILVYIQGRAVGPAAILPFLADELLITPIAAWGDIPYRAPQDYDQKMIQRRIIGMIDESLERAPVLKKLAEAMVDPHHQLIYENNRAQLEQDEKSHGFEPLILNQKGMISLGLVSGVLSDEDFIKTYAPNHEKIESDEIYYGIIDHYMTAEELDQSFRTHLPFNKGEENLFGFIGISPDHPINQSTYLYVKFALEKFKKRKVRGVVLHLNTPGGNILSTLRIVDLLQKFDLNEGIPVIAMVDDWAVSEGALLAYACRYIAVNPNSLMGADGISSSHIKAKQTEVNSALKSAFANTAQFYERDRLLAEAMVDDKMILVIRSHQIKELQSEKEIRASSRNPDVIISDKGKLLTLNAKGLIDLGVANFQVSVSLLPKITEEPFGSKKWPAKQMPIFEQPYLSEIPNAFMISYSNWHIAFFSVLAHPAVLSLLLMGLIVGFYIEINTPGFGIPGSIGVTCLFLILTSSFIIDSIHWVEVLILIIGLLLFAIELFVIPGFGVIGVLGIILTIISLLSVMLPGIDRLSLFDWDSFTLIGHIFIQRLLWFGSALLLSLGIILLLARFFAHRYFRFSRLGPEHAREIPRELMPKEGDLGETVSALNPSGQVNIGDTVYEAMAQTGFIQKRVPIEVVRQEGNKLIVRPLGQKEKI